MPMATKLENLRSEIDTFLLRSTFHTKDEWTYQVLKPRTKPSLVYSAVSGAGQRRITEAEKLALAHEADLRVKRGDEKLPQINQELSVLDERDSERMIGDVPSIKDITSQQTLMAEKEKLTKSVREAKALLQVLDRLEEDIGSTEDNVQYLWPIFRAGHPGIKLKTRGTQKLPAEVCDKLMFLVSKHGPAHTPNREPQWSKVFWTIPGGTLSIKKIARPTSPVSFKIGLVQPQSTALVKADDSETFLAYDGKILYPIPKPVQEKFAQWLEERGKPPQTQDSFSEPWMRRVWVWMSAITAFNKMRVGGKNIPMPNIIGRRFNFYTLRKQSEEDKKKKLAIASSSRTLDEASIGLLVRTEMKNALSELIGGVSGSKPKVDTTGVRTAPPAPPRVGELKAQASAIALPSLLPGKPPRPLSPERDPYSSAFIHEEGPAEYKPMVMDPLEEADSYADQAKEQKMKALRGLLVSTSHKGSAIYPYLKQRAAAMMLQCYNYQCTRDKEEYTIWRAVPPTDDNPHGVEFVELNRKDGIADGGDITALPPDEVNETMLDIDEVTCTIEYIIEEFAENSGEILQSLQDDESAVYPLLGSEGPARIIADPLGPQSSMANKAKLAEDALEKLSAIFAEELAVKDEEIAQLKRALKGKGPAIDDNVEGQEAVPEYQWDHYVSSTELLRPGCLASYTPGTIHFKEDPLSPEPVEPEQDVHNAVLLQTLAMTADEQTLLESTRLPLPQEGLHARELFGQVFVEVPAHVLPKFTFSGGMGSAVGGLAYLVMPNPVDGTFFVHQHRVSLPRDKAPTRVRPHGKASVDAGISEDILVFGKVPKETMVIVGQGPKGDKPAPSIGQVVGGSQAAPPKDEKSGETPAILPSGGDDLTAALDARVAAALARQSTVVEIRTPAVAVALGLPPPPATLAEAGGSNPSKSNGGKKGKRGGKKSVTFAGAVSEKTTDPLRLEPTSAADVTPEPKPEVKKELSPEEFSALMQALKLPAPLTQGQVEALTPDELKKARASRRVPEWAKRAAKEDVNNIVRIADGSLTNLTWRARFEKKSSKPDGKTATASKAWKGLKESFPGVPLLARPVTNRQKALKEKFDLLRGIYGDDPSLPKPAPPSRRKDSRQGSRSPSRSPSRGERRSGASKPEDSFEDIFKKYLMTKLIGGF